MTRAHRNINIAAVVLPFAAFLAAIPMLWNELVGWTDLVLLVVLYFLTALGITVGFHRLLTHRAFATYKPVEYLFAVLGSMDGEGVLGALRGLWHAHLGWLVRDHPTALGAEKYAPDLLEDRGMRIISKLFPVLVLLGVALPFALGWLITAELVGGLTALVWAGLVRVFMVHHVTFSINSICHFFGRRRFETDDESTNVFWLAIPTLGESWHHNHHAFPRSATHGLRWWEVDVGGLAIRAMRRLGLAWNVVRITPERQRARLAPRSQPTVPA